MSTISNTDDMIDSRDVIAALEEIEENGFAAYQAGWNMTGCLCDSEPMYFSEFEEAKNSILEYLQMEADSTENEKLAEEIESYIQDINLESGDFSVFVEPLNYWYWVSVSDDSDSPLDDNGLPLVADDLREYQALKEFASEFEDYCEDYRYGAGAIHEDYFTEYCMDMLADIGDLPAEIPDYIVIDKDATAEKLKVDYTEIDFDGQTYFVR